jgi:hypothetical protein
MRDDGTFHRWCIKHHHWLNDAPPQRTVGDELLASCSVPAKRGEMSKLKLEADHYALRCGQLERRVRELEAELAMLSDKACAAVAGYRAALARLTDSFKYSTEVVTIAREALATSETPVQVVCPCGFDSCNKNRLKPNEYCWRDRQAAGLAQETKGE